MKIPTILVEIHRVLALVCLGMIYICFEAVQEGKITLPFMGVVSVACLVLAILFVKDSIEMKREIVKDAQKKS